MKFAYFTIAFKQKSLCLWVNAYCILIATMTDHVPTALFLREVLLNFKGRRTSDQAKMTASETY